MLPSSSDSYTHSNNINYDHLTYFSVLRNSPRFPFYSLTVKMLCPTGFPHGPSGISPGQTSGAPRLLPALNVLPSGKESTDPGLWVLVSTSSPNPQSRHHTGVSPERIERKGKKGKQENDGVTSIIYIMYTTFLRLN